MRRERRLLCCYIWLLPILAHSMVTTSKSLVRVSEKVWREASAQHGEKIKELLLPGLTISEHSVNTGRHRKGSRTCESWLTALDPQNPIYNFLIEYYGLKGQKGTRRIARWSPTLKLLMQRDDRISELHQLTSPREGEKEAQFEGVLLEGACVDDLGGILHLKGAIPHTEGIVYSPSLFFSKTENLGKAATPYIWYRSVLKQTLKAEPVLHCHGMHEWAMQYWPEGAAPPPSAKYQQHLPLRVSREVVNAAVERRGISCTHVDALRYFAPAAGPLNHHGHSLQREKQLELEQPACVHAQMDLLKMALKLDPYCDPILLQKVLEVSLAARKLDVAASPYDATAFGVGVIAVETAEGRAEYRHQQVALMNHAEPVRKELLYAYDLLLQLGFGEHIHEEPAPERYSKAEPGGLPWRKNLSNPKAIVQ